MPYLTQPGYATVGAFDLATVKDKIFQYKWYLLGALALYVGYKYWWKPRRGFVSGW